MNCGRSSSCSSATPFSVTRMGRRNSCHRFSMARRSAAGSMVQPKADSGSSRRHHVLREELARSSRIEAHPLLAIEVEAEVVDRAAQTRHRLAEPDRRQQTPGCAGAQEPPVEDGVGQHRHGAVDGGTRVERAERPLVVRDGHRGVPAVRARNGVHRGVRGRVHARHPGKRAQEAAHRRLQRRPLGVQVAEHGQHPRFVERDPPANLRAHHRRAHRCEASEEPRRIVAGHATPVRQPHGQGEVLQRHHRFHAQLATGAHHVAVVKELVPVELSLARLHPRPFDGEAVSVVVHAGELAQVIAIAGVVVAGDSRHAAVLDPLGMLAFHPRPVVVEVSLHLVGGGGAAEQEVVRETADHGRSMGRGFERLPTSESHTAGDIAMIGGWNPRALAAGARRCPARCG